MELIEPMLAIEVSLSMPKTRLIKIYIKPGPKTN